ncbi:ribonuclease H-like domain-containing protein [Infundibulicybe gibba]|nr:ribonuclease H-like domain-containing protein [Infundibulicybe gibba]
MVGLSDELANDERHIEFHPTDNRIMCFPHVVNICVTHILKEFTKADLMNDTDEVFEPSGRFGDNMNQSFEEACARDPIALARNIVRVLRASGQRRDAFRDIIIDGNKKGWFAGKSGRARQLPVRELLRDVPTRWDSVYYMISRLRELRPAIDIFLGSPIYQDLAKYKMTAQEWRVLRDIEMVLSIPHRVQTRMSSESNPVLSNAIPLFETMMTNWERLCEKAPHLKRWIDVGLLWAKKYYKRMDLTRAYVIAMCPYSPLHCPS